MIKNVRFSEYRFYLNSKIQGDFQICISVPLSKSDPSADPCSTPKITSVLYKTCVDFSSLPSVS